MTPNFKSINYNLVKIDYQDSLSLFPFTLFFSLQILLI